MAFGRTRTVHPITAFWEWWRTEGESALTAATATGDYGKVAPALNTRVSAIDARLEWDLSAGVTSAHRLVISGAGVAPVRAIAERWLRAAPSPGPTWEFAASRQADPNASTATLEIAGRTLDLSQASWQLDIRDAARRIDVVAHHPQFATMDPQAAMQVVFLLLDWTIGEDNVERWIGGVEAGAIAPDSAVGGDGLVSAVRALDALRVEGDWLVGTWTREDGSEMVASARSDVRWIDRPTLDRVSVVRIAFRDRGDGLPDSEEFASLSAFDDGLEAELGERGMVVARTTEIGVRTVYVYSDSQDQNVRDVIDRHVKARRGARVRHDSDPNWATIRHITG